MEIILIITVILSFIVGEKVDAVTLIFIILVTYFFFFSSLYENIPSLKTLININNYQSFIFIAKNGILDMNYEEIPNYLSTDLLLRCSSSLK